MKLRSRVRLEDNKDSNVVSSSSSVGPARANLGNSPIYNQPRLMPAFREARMEDKMDALDLIIGIKGQNKFVNYGHLDIKARKAKDLEEAIQQAREEPIEEDENFPRATHLAKRLIDTEPGLDFMDSEKREKLLELYSQDPRVLPTKEIKPLKFSKMDRFSNNIEVNLATAGKSFGSF
jgi:hypothetical protein